MAKKQKTNRQEPNQTGEIVKKVKSAFLEAIVKEWLNTPDRVFDGKTPLQVIRDGDGYKIIEILNQLKSNNDNNNQKGNLGSKPKHDPIIENGSGQRETSSFI